MKSALSFKQHFEDYFSKSEDQSNSQKFTEDFFSDFVHYTPLKLELLDSYIKSGQIDHFYQSLVDLKYLVEFSDNLNRYWYMLRAYSGALAKLKADPTAKASKKLYSYYFGKYGDRRMLRTEHWFEKNRWEFLDELQMIYNDNELSYFIRKYEKVLNENFKIYESFILAFIVDIKSLRPIAEVVNKMNKN
jgi:hypothetical protein